MKTLSNLGIMVALGSTLFLSSCAGEYYVSDQPADVVYDPGAPPYAGAVWIGDDWAWSGGRYVHQRGHWARARANRTYVRGSWSHGQRGYSWHRGHWR